MPGLRFVQHLGMDTSWLSSFATAADAGSLSLAAARLGVQVSTLSRHVTELERTLGVTLFERTGRGVRLTPAGERYLERAQHVLRELEAAAADARGDRRAALTHLRLSAPLELSLRLLPPTISALAKLHPELRIDVHSDARQVSLLEEDFDAAIRIGALGETSLLARPLGTISLVLCGSPAAGGALRRRSDLDAAEVVLVAGTRTELEASHRGRRVPVRLRGRIRVSTFSEALAIVEQSREHIALLPSYTAIDGLRAGRLVLALPRLHLPSAPLHLVHPPRLRAAAPLRDLDELVTGALAAIEASLQALALRA